MFFIKVLFHNCVFLFFYACLYYYFDIGFTILASIYVYVASYYVSLWIIKFIFLFPCTKVKPENKSIFITGCDTGFGHITALKLNEMGFKVFATCLQPTGEGAIQLMNKAKHPTKMVIIGMDVTNDIDIKAAHEIVKNSMDPTELLFGLVNNAGIALSSEFEWGPDITQGKKCIDVNLMGMIKVTRQFLPLIRQAKGRIVNVESFAGLIPMPRGIFYSLSKAGSVGFSDNLRIEMYKFGVSVVSINPTMYKTPISDATISIPQFESAFKQSSEEVRKAYGETFMEKAKSSFKLAKFAPESNTVPDVIVSALTVYEPDPRYIVAPFLMQPLLRLWMWLPKETLETHQQILSWFIGTHKVYSE